MEGRIQVRVIFTSSGRGMKRQHEKRAKWTNSRSVLKAASSGLSDGLTVGATHREK